MQFVDYVRTIIGRNLAFSHTASSEETSLAKAFPRTCWLRKTDRLRLRNSTQSKLLLRRNSALPKPSPHRIIRLIKLQDSVSLHQAAPTNESASPTPPSLFAPQNHHPSAYRQFRSSGCSPRIGVSWSAVFVCLSAVWLALHALQMYIYKDITTARRDDCLLSLHDTKLQGSVSTVAGIFVQRKFASTMAAEEMGYFLKSEEETNRLANQHDVIKDEMGGLVLAPLNLSKPLRILDSATADGAYLLLETNYSHGLPTHYPVLPLRDIITY